MVRNEKIARSNSGRPCLTRGIYGLTEPEYEEARLVPSRHTCLRKEYFTTSFSAKTSFTLGMCVYKTTILNSKRRWNISELNGLILSMRATRAQKHTSQGGMSLLVHHALSDRFSKHASISDAAHQALLAYHGKHYEERKNDKQKYLPRRPPGTCNV